MRLLLLVLLALVCLIQYPLWLGKGGWFNVWNLQKQVAKQHAVNDGMRARNAALEAEVHDLQTGTGAIEGRARNELGMMKDGEVFVQIVPPEGSTSVGNASSGTVSTARLPVGDVIVGDLPVGKGARDAPSGPPTALHAGDTLHVGPLR